VWYGVHSQTIKSQSTTSSCSKASRGEPRGPQSSHKHRQLACQVGDATLIHDDSMAIIFNTPITFNVREVFRFGSISYIADQEGVDCGGRLATPKKRSSLMVPIAEEGSPRLTSTITSPMNSKARRPQPTFAPRRIASA
jgi:hypothetical protein